MNPQMAATFRAGLGDYVSRLEAVQAELLSLYRRKRVALTAADAPGLAQLEAPERQAADRLKALVGERQQMLVRAEQFGTPAGSLGELAASIGCDTALLGQIAACRRRATTLRREGWVHWIVAKRTLAQTAALLDLIAHRGDRPATYGATRPPAGGALLDASA